MPLLQRLQSLQKMNYRSDGELYLEMCTYALCAVAVNT